MRKEEAPVSSPFRARLAASPIPPVLFCWAVYLILMLFIWRYIGVVEGEEIAASAAYAWLHQIPQVLSAPHVRVLGWNIPLMFDVYMGPWAIYSIAPFFALGSCTLATLRCYNAAMFLLALFGAYCLTRELYRDAAIAFLSTLLLGVCPALAASYSAYVQASSLSVASSAWTLYFGLSFARGRRPAFACLSCASFLMGLCACPWLAGLGAGLGLCFLLMPRRCLALLPKAPREKLWLAGGGLLCAGIILLPVLLYNVLNAGRTIRFFARHLLERDHLPTTLWYFGSWSNLKFAGNLKVRVAHLAMLCDGDWIFVLAGKPWHLLYIGPLLFSFARTAREAWETGTLWFKTAVLWTIAIGYVLASAVSPTELGVHQLLPLTPVLAALMLDAVDANRTPRGRRAALAIAGAACAAQFFGDFSLLRKDNVNLAQRGYYGASPVLAEVGRWAADNPRTPMVPLSGAVSQALPYFSQFRARVVPFSSCGSPLRWEKWLAQRDVPYQASASSDSPIPWEKWLRRRDKPDFIAQNDTSDDDIVATMKSEAVRIGVTLIPVKIFTDDRGRTEFEAYAVR
ncbi:MAG: hypothetical protein ACHQ2Z_00245 [Elusimicrobiota bacterium]